MAESLWPQLRLKANSKQELIELYRSVYLETYVYDEQSRQRIFEDWTGAKIIFSKDAFDHAFSKAINYRDGHGIHDAGFAEERARRMLWIAEVLKASAGNIQRYTQTVKDSRGRQKKRRTYVVLEESYVVVLDDPRNPNEPYRFVTAIPATKDFIESQIKRQSFLCETKKGN